MLFELLLANITILLCFFYLFCVIFNVSYNSCNYWKCKTKTLALAIPSGATITGANDAIDIPLFAADKKNKDLSK